MTVSTARPVLGARAQSAMVRGADTPLPDGNGLGAGSRIGVVPPETRSVMGKCTSKSHVPEFRR